MKRLFAIAWRLVAMALMAPLHSFAGVLLIPAPQIPPDGVTIINNGGILSAPGGIIIQGDTNVAGAFLRRSTTNSGYQLEYAPGAITSFVALTEYYPMKLVSYSTGLWYAATHIYPYQTNYPDFSTGTNVIYPVPGIHPQWVQFARNGNDGATGSQGASGVNGANGVGNINYSTWSSTFGYSSNTPTVVSYAGQWYDLIAATSSNEAPTSYTNVWAISVAKGTGGTILGTNIVMRGSYDAGYTYTTNDGVSYNGSSFYIGLTNVALGAGNAPSGSQPPSHGPMWTVLASIGNQGPQGAQGNDGADGNVITNINNYQTIISTGTVYITDGTTTVTPQTVYYRTGTNFGIVSWNPTTSVAIVEIKTNFGAGVTVTNTPQAAAIKVLASSDGGTNYYLKDDDNSGGAGVQSPWTNTVDGNDQALYDVQAIAIGSNHNASVYTANSPQPQLLVYDGPGMPHTNWLLGRGFGIMNLGQESNGWGHSTMVGLATDTANIEPEFCGYRSGGTITNPAPAQAGYEGAKYGVVWWTSNGWQQGGFIELVAETSGWGAVVSDTPTRMSFGVNKDGSGIWTTMTIRANQRVGIGTDEPEWRLHVAGDADHSSGSIAVSAPQGYNKQIIFLTGSTSQWQLATAASLSNSFRLINSAASTGAEPAVIVRSNDSAWDFQNNQVINANIEANSVAITGRLAIVAEPFNANTGTIRSALAGAITTTTARAFFAVTNASGTLAWGAMDSQSNLFSVSFTAGLP